MGLLEDVNLCAIHVKCHNPAQGPAPGHVFMRMSAYPMREQSGDDKKSGTEFHSLMLIDCSLCLVLLCLFDFETLYRVLDWPGNWQSPNTKASYRPSLGWFPNRKVTVVFSVWFLFIYLVGTYPIISTVWCVLPCCGMKIIQNRANDSNIFIWTVAST